MNKMVLDLFIAYDSFEGRLNLGHLSSNKVLNRVGFGLKFIGEF